MKTLKEITDQLKAPLPAEAIKPHPTKNYLSTINPIYVIERLNEVFGLDGWSFNSEIIEVRDKWVVIKGTLTLLIGDLKNHKVEQFGGNDNPDLGDAYKGAATDALTKCASYIGIGADVWKHKGTTQTDKPKQEDNRPWITEKALNQAIERIRSGEIELYSKTISAFRMKKQYTEELKKAYDFQTA